MESEVSNKRRLSDFHVHYTTDESVERTLQLARSRNVSTVALVKRAEISDNFGNYVSRGAELGIKVITGVENMARVNGRQIDFLALGFDLNGPALDLFGSKETIAENSRIANLQLQYLTDKGYKFEDLAEIDRQVYEDLLKGVYSEKAAKFCRIALTLSTNISLLKDEIRDNQVLWVEIVRNYSTLDDEMKMMKFMYFNHFAFNRPGYIPVQKSIEEVLEAVHASRGVILYSPEGKYNSEIWQYLSKLGIDGIMAWHGSKSEFSKSELKEFRRTGHLVLGGSDYDPDKEDWQVGIGSGDMYLSAMRFRDLSRYIENKFHKSL
jgi:predicted metal-dependent phosphoesterase TrpH